MFGLGFGEVVLVLIIALVFIGPKKLPELAKSLGKGMKQFQDAAKGFQDQVTREVNDLKPQIDPNDLPKLDDVKTELTDIIPNSNNSGHGNWEPNPSEPKIPDSIPKKDENKA